MRDSKNSNCLPVSVGFFDGAIKLKDGSACELPRQRRDKSRSVGSIRRRRALGRPLATAAFAAAAIVLRPSLSRAQFLYPTLPGQPTVLNANYNKYVSQEQSQFSGAASILMMLNASTVNINPTAGAFATAQQNLSSYIVNHPGVNPVGVFTADAYSMRATLAAADTSRTYVAYTNFNMSSTNSANLTLAYNITHYNEPGAILTTQMNPTLNTMSYSWMDVYGVSSSKLPVYPVNGAITVSGFYVRDPWTDYRSLVASAAIKAVTPPGLVGTNAFLANNRAGEWSQFFQPYNPRNVQAPGSGPINGIPASTFSSSGLTTLGKYQFVTDPDEDDTTLDTVDEYSGTPAPNASTAISDATSDLAGTTDPGADTGLSSLTQFEGGAFQTTGDDDVPLPGDPGDSEWVLGYYPSGSSSPTGAVTVDQETGDISGAFWNDDDSPISLPDLDTEVTDVGDGYDPSGMMLTSQIIPVPEPAAASLLAVGSLVLLRRRRIGHGPRH